MTNPEDPTIPDHSPHGSSPQTNQREQIRRIDEAYGKLLYASGAIRIEQLQECQQLQERLRLEHPKIRLGQILIKKGYVSRATIEEVLSKYSQLPPGTSSSQAKQASPATPATPATPASIPLDDPPSVDEFTGLGQDPNAETIITNLPEWARPPDQPPESVIPPPAPLDNDGIPLTSNPAWSEEPRDPDLTIETSGASIDVDELLAEDTLKAADALDIGLPGSGFDSPRSAANLANLPADPADTVPIGVDGAAIPWGSSLEPPPNTGRATSGLGREPGPVDPNAHTAPAIQTPASKSRGSSAWTNISSDTDAPSRTPGTGFFSNDPSSSRAQWPWMWIVVAAAAIIFVTTTVAWKLTISKAISTAIAKADDAYAQEDWKTALENYDIVIGYDAGTPEIEAHRDTCVEEIVRLEDLLDWLTAEASRVTAVVEAITRAEAVSDPDQREQILTSSIREHQESGELFLARGRTRRHANHRALLARSVRQANQLRRSAQADLSKSNSLLELKLAEVESEMAKQGISILTEALPSEFPLDLEAAKPEVMMASLAQQAKLRLAECKIEVALHWEFDTGKTAKAGTSIKEAKLHATEAWMKDLIQGWQALARRDFAKAAEALDRSERANPGLAEVPVLQAQAKLALGDLDNAEAAARRAMERSPLLGRAHSILASIALRRGKVDDETYQLAEKGALLAPQDPLCLVINGRALEHRDRPDEALRAYDDALKIAPSDIDARLHRGLLRVQEKDLQLALSDLDTVIRLRPRNAEARYARGKARHSMRNYKEARKDYQEAVSLDPSHSKAWANLATVLMYEKDYSGSHDAQERALALDPDNRDILYNFSWMNWLVGDFDNALPLIWRALDNSPADWKKTPMALIIRADCLANHSPPKIEEALRDFQAAISLTPGQLEIYKRRAFLWRRIKDDKRELDDLRTWQRLDRRRRFPAAEVKRITELESLLKSGDDEQTPRRRRLFPPRRGGD